MRKKNDIEGFLQETEVKRQNFIGSNHEFEILEKEKIKINFNIYNL